MMNKLYSIVTNKTNGNYMVDDGGKVVTSDINNLYNQITAFGNDTYFKTQPTLYATDYSIVGSGTTIYRNVVTPIQTTVTGIAKIKCRNDATNSSGTNSNTTNNNTTCNRSTNGNTCSRSNQGKTCSNSTQGRTCSNSTNAHVAHTHGVKAHSTVIDILNASSTKANT